MLFGEKLKYWVRKVFRYSLLILFVSYYISITQFTHCHIINGITIVHSHPYKSGKGSNSNGMQHTEKELQVIQFLSEFFTTAVGVTFAALIFRYLLREIPVNPAIEGYSLVSGYCTYSLRAPPYEM